MYRSKLCDRDRLRCFTRQKSDDHSPMQLSYLRGIGIATHASLAMAKPFETKSVLSSVLLHAPNRSVNPLPQFVVPLANHNRVNPSGPWQHPRRRLVIEVFPVIPSRFTTASARLKCGMQKSTSCSLPLVTAAALQTMSTAPATSSRMITLHTARRKVRSNPSRRAISSRRSTSYPRKSLVSGLPRAWAQRVRRQCPPELFASG